VLVELGLVEQRFQAVLEVLNEGATVTDVARRYGVARQTVHGWLRRYASSGLGGLVDQSSKPGSCPHQMGVEVEARIVALRRANPGWGPRRLGAELVREGLDPVPGRSSIYRALVRHGLIEPSRRRRRRSDYKRWERSRAMELWQMDVMGRVRLVDRSELSVVTGIDDHSRFCVIASLVRRATARPVCEALMDALGVHGLPEAILTDNGKVFTGRFGLAKGPVLFDRICHDNGIRHLLTAPYSPTTTGKIERLHKTMRAELFNTTTFQSLEEAQQALDAWVRHYNTERPHQGIGDRAPIERFQLAQGPEPVLEIIDTSSREEPVESTPRITRRVASTGVISLAGSRYRAGRWLAGEVVDVVSRDGVVEISHRGALIVTHARRHPPGKEPDVARSPRVRAPRPATIGNPVLRITDQAGCVSFAGTNYSVGRGYARRQVEVAIVAGSVQLAVDGKVLRVHPIRHDRTKEHGAFASPNGRPRKRTVA
jgi:transposase InsO family protein